MAYGSNITTSLYGRRLGLQKMSSSQTGGAYGEREFLVGPDDVRVDVSTAETTSANLKAFGVSRLTTSVSSGVYTLDPPIPGVTKTLIFDTTGADPIYVKTNGGEYISTTQGTTYTVLASSQTALAAVTLIGASTSQYFAVGAVSSAYLRGAATT